MPTAACAAIFFTELRNDDRGGRDVLYPIPEPGTSWLLAAGLAALVAGRSLAHRSLGGGGSSPACSRVRATLLAIRA